MRYKTYSKLDVDNKKVELKPGNFIVTHGTGIMDRMIQIFTNSHWNHAALVVSSSGETIESVSKGIRKNNLKEYGVNELYLIDAEMSEEDRKQVIEYAHFMLKKHSQYGFLTIASIAFKIITHSRLVIKLDGTLICSEFVAKALEEGGVIWDKDGSLITPADLYLKFVRS